MGVMELFDRAGQPTPEALHRRADPVTSRIAAERAINFTGKHEATIYNAICEAGLLGVTYKEIAHMTGMEPVAVARRLSAMEGRKLIERRVKDGAVRLDDWQASDGCALWWAKR